ncbi:MAG TPA: MFS transporter [Gammaproteobacteria bacterium]
MSAAEAEARASWMPLVVIALAQLLLVFNLTTLKVSVDAIAEGLGTPASSVKTAIVLHFLVVAAFIMLGARIAQRFGARHVFRATALMLTAAMALTAAARNAGAMMLAQTIAGMASAALIPTSVVMISDHYRGSQQSRALGWLGAMQAIGIVPAFLIAGYLAVSAQWRLTFALLAVFAAGLYFSGASLRGADTRARIHIDAAGVVLAASAMLLIGIGADKVAYWGVWRARPAAPLSVFDLSPAPIAIVAGVLLLHAFVVWTRRCRATGRMPLCAPELLGSTRERSALLSMFTIGALGAGLTFLIPLYIEVVQGRTSLYTAVALVPFTLASFATAIVIVRFDSRLGARRIARAAFLLVACGLALLGATVRNDWSDTMVVLALIVTGLGEGALAAVLFKLLSSSVPGDLAGDVGSVCGSTSFLGSGVGTALAAGLLVGVLGSSVRSHVSANPLISAEIRAQFDLDSVSFVSNEQLLRALERTNATPNEVSEAVRINTEARLDALKVSFYVLAGLALLAFVPAAGVSKARGGK